MLPVWEATLDEIEGKLLELSASQLRDLCEMLMLNVREDETHTPRALRRRILQYLEGDDVVSLEDEGLSMLLDKKEKIDSLINVESFRNVVYCWGRCEKKRVVVEEEKEEEELTRFVHVKTFSPRICHRKQKRKTTGANKSTRKEKLSWLLSKGAT